MSTKVLIPRVSSMSSSSTDSDSVSVHSVSTTPGRKRKLDHLSFEEKVQRKKLKNRVAAQTSRDRKKKQMEEMLDTIEKQSKEISQWENRFNQLKTKFEKMEKEMRKLKADKKQQPQIPKHQHSIPEEHKYTRSALERTSEDNSVGSVVIKTEGPAVSKNIPLPKVTKLMNTETTERSSRKQRQSHMKATSDVKALLKVIMLSILYKHCSKTSTSSTILKNLQKAWSPISIQKWKQMLHQAISQMPKMKARNSNALDQWWTSDCLGPENQEWNPPKIVIEAH